MSYTSENNIVGGIIFLIFGIVVFFKGFKLLKLDRQIRGLATSKIRSMAMGLCEATGKAVILNPLVDPIYLRPCAYFHITIKEHRRRRRHSTWETIYFESSNQFPFLLRDDTGELIIDPNGVEIHMDPTLSMHNGLLGNANKDSAVLHFMEKHRSFLRTLKIEAYLIRENDPLYVLGTVNPPAASPKNFLVSLKEAAAKLKSNPRIMASLDTNADGHIDSREWDKGVKSIQSEIERENIQKSHLESKPLPVNNLLTLKKSSDGVLVFGSSENDLTSRLKWKVLLFIGGGSALILFSVFLLSKSFWSF